MKLRQNPVPLFFLATALPFIASFIFFLFTQRLYLLTEPEIFMDVLTRSGSLPHSMSLGPWKFFLARGELCRRSETVVIGNSRLREIDSKVLGTSTCNLYVDGLGAAGFAKIAHNLSPMAPGRNRVIYVGIDHTWLLWADPVDSLELKLLSGPSALRMLWKSWAVVRPLETYSIRSLRDAVRSYIEDQSKMRVWFPEGHVSFPWYYAQKRAGIHRSFNQAEIDDGVNSVFDGQRLRESGLRDLEQGVRLLHAKGYLVRVFWTPVSAAHIASARRRFPELFDQIKMDIDRLASTLPVDHYLPANQTLDASRFGCTERDDYDETHLDIDCVRRVFASILHRKTSERN